MATAKCFFCYAWCDNDHYDYLKFIASQIRSRSKEKIEVILDRESYKANDDFEEKEREINTYDLIIVCNSSELRKIYDSPDKYRNRRVLRELDIIEKRLNNDHESVFSILVEGTKDVIIPIFKNKNTKDINDFSFFPYKGDSKYEIAVSQEREFNDFIDRIIHLTKVNNLNHSADYCNAREALDNLLKLTDITNLPQSCLVYTDIYNKITHQNGIVYFVVGRKGAGKSTLIHNFKNYDSNSSNYKQTVPISAESFQHELAYSVLYLGHEKDSNVMPPLKTFELFWEVFFTLYSIISVGCELEVGGINKEDKRYEVFAEICTTLKDELSMKDASGEYKDFYRTDDVIDQLFRYCIDIIDEQFNNPAENVGNKLGIYSAFTANMNVDDILINIFCKNEIIKFADGLNTCEKRIIISIDGFDDHAEQFRNDTMNLSKDSDVYQKRIHFDNIFFRSMLNVAQCIKKKNYQNRIFSTFCKCIDFCIVIPNDRYNLIVDYDRDITKKKFVALMWDAKELLDMVIKRLEYLVQYMSPQVKIDKTIENPFIRFNCLIDLFPSLPHEVGINIKGVERKVSLFNYLLRYSFWRPRDIISNLNSVMSAVITVEDNNNTLKHVTGDKLTSLDIRILTKSNIESIYRSEFISEFKNVYTNLNDVLEHFKGKNIAYSICEFKEEMNFIHFSTAFASKISTFEDKTKTLYKLGIIGILYPKNSNVEYISKTCFVFNCGMIPLEDLLKTKMKTNLKIIFNPLIAHCQDMVWNISDVIGNWTEEEILQMHRLQSAVKGL